MQAKKLLIPLFSLSFTICLFISGCSPAGKATNSGADPEVLIFGGGDHHNFNRWFNREDSSIIAGTAARVSYTDDPEEVLPTLSEIDVLNINTNQAINVAKFPERVSGFVREGNGLLLVHAATWFIWDWPDYYRDLIGGGTSSHGPFGEFEVYVTDTNHPVTAKLPERFTIKDELYRFKKNEAGADMHVLAVGVEPGTGNEYPVVWTVNHGKGRVVNITLGHDGEAHQHKAFVALMENSIKWLSK